LRQGGYHAAQRIRFLLGMGISVVSILLYLWSVTAKLPRGGNSAIDLRRPIDFFGGMGIGIGVVATMLVLGWYALRQYALHAAMR